MHTTGLDKRKRKERELGRIQGRSEQEGADSVGNLLIYKQICETLIKMIKIQYVEEERI